MRNQNVIRLHHQLEANQAAGMVVFDGIAGKVLQRLFQQVRVGVDVDVGWNLAFNMKCGGLRLAIFDDIGEHRAQIYRLEL